MKKTISIIFLVVIISISCSTNSSKQVQKDQGSKIEFIDKTSDNTIDVMIDCGFKVFRKSVFVYMVLIRLRVVQET